MSKVTKHLSKEQEEIKLLKQNTENIARQLNQVTAQAIQFKDIAQSSEIVLNRTLRYLTGRIIQLKKNPTNEGFEELIEYLNRIEDDKPKGD